MREGVRRAPVAQIADQDHVQSFECAVGLSNRKQIQHSLSRMVASAVTSVQHRNFNRVGAVLSRTLLRVANHSDVRIAIDHLHRIVESLALGNT